MNSLEKMRERITRVQKVKSIIDKSTFANSQSVDKYRQDYLQKVRRERAEAKADFLGSDQAFKHPSTMELCH